MKNIKKFVFPAALLLVLIGAVCAANSRQILSAISGIKASDAPVITNAFLDKTKYVIGDQMLITASVEDNKGIKEVKAEIENENGIDAVKLNLIGGDDKKGTWQAAWTVHDVTGKRVYKTKMIAINSEEQQSEFALYWIDPAPNPGHLASEVGGTTDAERTFNSGGLYTFSGGLNVAGQIKISGGSPGAGKVLTSDASGLGSWKTGGGGECGWYKNNCPDGWTNELGPEKINTFADAAWSFASEIRIGTLLGSMGMYPSGTKWTCYYGGDTSCTHNVGSAVDCCKLAWSSSTFVVKMRSYASGCGGSCTDCRYACYGPPEATYKWCCPP